MMTYEAFAAAYTKAFKNMMAYTLEQVGSDIYEAEMVALADAYPEFLEKFEAEEAAA
jgi:hypothetical protein